MASSALNKRKGAKPQKASPKKKQKKESFTARNPKKPENVQLLDHSDEEEIEEHEEEFDGDEQGSGSDSDTDSYGGDDPLPGSDDSLHGSDDDDEEDEGTLFLVF